jgi:hypothetical protein
MGWRALAPCVTSLHPETDRLEAKQLRVCLLSKRAEVLRQKSKVKVKSRSQRCARPQKRGLGFALALAASRLASCPLAISTGFCFALAKSGPVCLQPQKKEAPANNLIALGPRNYVCACLKRKLRV